MENININKLPLIGKGTHGRVYRLDKNRCLKVCKKTKDMQMEYEVLKHVKGYSQFPRVYECKANYMIREYVDGPNIKVYIKQNGFNNSLARQLTELIRVFIKLKFTRIDIRMGELFVTSDHKLKIIDTTRYLDKKAPYPFKMLKVLKGLGYYKQYIKFLKENYPDFYRAWTK
ncbi:MAG: serine/threonine protein kinase [Clostridiaceae bacterium]|nr:serine/threonine protein kinase [Clostridiaceae bacterium]